jgi:GntR family transcriptional regulator
MPGGNVDLIISQRSDEPIYQQIQDQITRQILDGSMGGGTPLPSIRALAQELHISVITVKKAYEELEKQGFIVTVAAKGSFVTEQDDEQLVQNQIRRIEGQLATVVAEASVLHISVEQMHAIIERLYAQSTPKVEN